jgi:putative Holliday junction resolvase
MRALGIDIGTVRIGLAVGDDRHRLATPLATVAAQPQSAALEAIARLVEEHGVDTLVFGLPLELSGREGRMARLVRTFAEALGERLALPVEFVDERMSSIAAERSLVGADVRRAERKQVIDRVAATLFLQSWLDGRPR